MQEFDHTSEVLTCAFSPDGTLVAAGGGDSKLTLRSVATGETVQVFDHTSEVSTCAFSPDGTLVAAGGYDNKLTLRSVATGETVQEFDHTSGVYKRATASWSTPATR